jgi:PAS domain S-box-containing protein/putative nucleotidyltransferase with HDIG domain
MKQIKILLVEDNLDDRLLIKRGISKGIESPTIIEALNPQELNQAVIDDRFDIVITDYNLGWTDGIEVLKLVKNSRPDCPVIMMTVMDTEEVAIKAMNAGLDNYIVKSSSQFALMGEIIKGALEQRQQAQALQDAESRYQELFETVPIGLFRETKDGVLINLNDTLVNMLGYPSKEMLLNTNVNHLYIKPSERLENVSQLTPKNDLRSWEALIRQYSGNIISVAVTAQGNYDPNGELIFFEGYVRDITERKRVEEALSQSEILNETIIASVNDGVVVVDRDLKIITWNKFMEEISGMTQNEVTGKPLVEVFPSEMENAIEAALQKTLDGKTIDIPDTRLHFPKSDKHVWFETTFSPLRTQQRRLIGVVANIHDISQRKEDERERELLLAAEQHAHSATREISSLLNLDDIVRATNRLIVEVTGGEFAGVLILDPDTGSPLNMRYYNAPEEAPEYIPESEEGLTPEILAERQVFTLQDYSSHPKALSFWKDQKVKAVMSVPLQTSDSLIGLVTVFTKDPDKTFTTRDQEQAISIARQASVAMHKAILYEQTKRRTEELSALYDIALATGGVLDSNTLISRLQANIERFLNPDRFGFFFYHEDTNSYQVATPVCDDNPIGEEENELYPLTPGGLISEVMLHHKPVKIDDLSLGDRKNVLHGANLPLRSWLGIPLISGDRLVGALSVQSSKPNAFSEEDQRFLESIAGQVSIALDNAHLYEELEDAFVQTVIALANAVDVRDSYTKDHSQRIAVYAHETGKLLGLDGKELENLRWGALLHDIGKIGVPDHILLKPAQLTDEEYENIKRHPSLGAAIVAPVKKLQPVAPIIRAHQERYDGKGYPDQLAGDQIPLAARILAVVDSYVAMTDDRVYRKALSHEQAIQELRNVAGRQHDPKVVNAFLEIVDTHPNLFQSPNISFD